MKNTAPTKSNYLKLSNELKFTRLGHELLDQKRNILINELMALVDQTADFQEEVERSLKTAYKALDEAVVHMGQLRVLSASSAVNMRTSIRIKSRRIMGVDLPVVETNFIGNSPYYSTSDSSFWMDFALADFKKVLSLMGRLAELKISVMRLASEVKKTIRKVNALEKIAIPDLEESVAYIKGRLEENERDMFVLMKMVKSRLEKRKIAARRTG